MTKISDSLEHSSYDRILLRISGALFGVAAVVAVGVFAAANKELFRTKKPVVSQAREWHATMSPEESKLYIAATRQMRGEWRAWALKHRHDLTAMLKAPISDQAAFDRVYHQLPNDSRYPNLGFSQSLLATGYGFSAWTGAENQKTSATPKNVLSQKRESGVLIMAQARQRQGWQQRRDIILFSTMHPARMEYAFWASGRITETQMPRWKKTVRETYANIVEKDIVPPYEFLAQP